MSNLSMTDGAMNSSDPSAPPPLPPVSPDEILFDTLFMAICGALGVIFGVAGVYAVKRNSILKGIIEHYAFVDLLNLILINGCHLFWGVPCALWTLNEVIPFLDHLFGGLAFTAPSIGFPPKLFLAMNRFCALSFDGRFYKRFEETKIIRYSFMIAYPLATAAVYAIPGCRGLFIPYGANYFYVEPGDCGLELVYYTQALASFIFLPISTFLDCAIYYLMRKRMRAFQASQAHNSKHKGEQLKKEFKLAAQMLINLCTGILLTASITFSQSYLVTPLATFLVFTALWQFCTLVSSMSYAILLRERKPKIFGVTVSVSGVTQSTKSPRR